MARTTCKSCGNRPVYVAPGGKRYSYCRMCINRRNRDRYRNDRSVRTRAQRQISARYKEDPVFREHKMKKSRDFFRSTGYARTDRFRLSAIKSNMRRLDDDSLAAAVDLLLAEAKRRRLVLWSKDGGMASICRAMVAESDKELHRRDDRP